MGNQSVNQSVMQSMSLSASLLVRSSVIVSFKKEDYASSLSHLVSYSCQSLLVFHFTVTDLCLYRVVLTRKFPFLLPSDSALLLNRSFITKGSVFM